MIKLKLFTQLQGDATASLILQRGRAGSVQFFLVSSSVNHSIVVSGECPGELPDSQPKSFDIVLTSLVPLLDKNIEFSIDFSGGVLRFVEANEKFSVEPLCVEHIADQSLDIVQRYLAFAADLDKSISSASKLEEAEQELARLRSSYKEAKIYTLSGFKNDPFGDPDDVGISKIDEHYNPLILQAEERVKCLRDEVPSVVRANMADLKRIASIAAKFNTTVAMCGDYAVASLDSVFVVQKVDCGVRAIQGKLLQRLLQESTGVVYNYNNELVFVSVAEKTKNPTRTTIFLQPYLPSTVVDSTIITRGAVKEKYALNLKGLLPVVSAVISKFDQMEFDMGAACMRLSNERGERLVHKFDVEDAKTLELNKLMRGEPAGSVVMSTLEVPRIVQKILPFFRDNFTVYVKEKKVVFQSGTLYLVFGR